MLNQRSKIKNHTFRPGFTIVECLIGLAISAVLLTAVAVAFNASVINYQENEEMFRALNNARQALARMTGELRTAYPVQTTETNNQCSFFTAANENITYVFQANEGKLYLRKNATNQQYVLCDNVVAARFDKVLTQNGDDVRGVEISLTVQSGHSHCTLSSVAAIRRCPYLVNSSN